MKFRKFDIDDSEDIQRAWNIYEDSFPQYERRLIDTQRKKHRSSYYKPMVIVDEKNRDEAIGVFFYWDFDNLVFIEHFAIDDKYRGMGLGSRIMKVFCNEDKLIVLEIDPLDSEIAVRRKMFYEKLGFVYNDHYYTHPGYEIHYPEHELKLMTFGKALDQETMKEFLFLRNKFTLD